MLSFMYSYLLQLFAPVLGERVTLPHLNPLILTTKHEGRPPPPSPNHVSLNTPLALTIPLMLYKQVLPLETPFVGIILLNSLIFTN